jgi:hypothetical protein
MRSIPLAYYLPSVIAICGIVVAIVYSLQFKASQVLGNIFAIATLIWSAIVLGSESMFFALQPRNVANFGGYDEKWGEKTILWRFLGVAIIHVSLHICGNSCGKSA